MITRDGRVKVLDFGLAKDLRMIGLQDETVTYIDQTQVGTVMPPAVTKGDVPAAFVKLI